MRFELTRCDAPLVTLFWANAQNLKTSAVGRLATSAQSLLFGPVDLKPDDPIRLDNLFIFCEVTSTNVADALATSTWKSPGACLEKSTEGQIMCDCVMPDEAEIDPPKGFSSPLLPPGHLALNYAKPSLSTHESFQTPQTAGYKQQNQPCRP